VTRLNELQSYVVFSGWLCLQMFFCGYLYSLRSDALLVFLLALACCAFRRYLDDQTRTWSLIVCAFLLFLGAVTKQHAFFALAGLLTTLLWRRDYRGAGLLVAVVAVCYAPFTFWLNSVTHGWYLHTLLLGSHHTLAFATFSLLTSHAIPVFLLGSGFRSAWFSLRVRPYFTHPDTWIYCVAAWYLVIAVLALMKGGPGSMNNLAFVFAILLPAASTVIGTNKWSLLGAAVLLVVSLPSYIVYQPFAGWLVYAPAQAQQVVDQIQASNGPVLLGRRQEFLLRTGRPVLDDLGATYFEFVPAGYGNVAVRINREIQSGKYQLMMLESDELANLDEPTRTYLAANYDISDDPGRAIFEIRLTRRLDQRTQGRVSSTSMAAESSGDCEVIRDTDNVTCAAAAP
jgi:hypothetical protein